MLMRQYYNKQAARKGRPQMHAWKDEAVIGLARHVQASIFPSEGLEGCPARKYRLPAGPIICLLRRALRLGVGVAEAKHNWRAFGSRPALSSHACKGT